MSQQPSLFKRLKRSRIVQALLVYLAASYAVLQLVETPKELLALPDWIGPVTVILVGIGLLVITATAWVQSLDSTTKAEEAGEVPTDWEIDAADALASLKAGRLPHLTWGRAILGGVVALSLTIGAAGAYVLVTGGQGLLGPAEAGAGVVAEGIAVLPFDARGDELAIYREGMVDLLSASFDGIGGYRTINSRTVFARWEEEVGQATAPDLDAALRAAGRTGARYAILGSMVPAGTQVRINVDIYDLSDGSNIGSARVDGSPDDIFALVDGLSVAIARELLGAAGEQAATERRLASITTSSVDALKDFLEGERLYRLGDFVGAAEALERAVTTDSTFALAWVRLGGASGWVANDNRRSREARLRALAISDRLSPREVVLNRARTRYDAGDVEAIAMLKEYVRRYPDDAEGWYNLGDSYYHMTADMQGLYDASREQAWSALGRAAELDPGFSPFQIHMVDFAFAAGDSAAARLAIDAYRATSGADNTYSSYWDAGFDILFGDEATMQEGIAAALELPDSRRALGLLGRQFGGDLVPRELELMRALSANLSPAQSFDLMASTLLRAGRWQESGSLFAESEASVDPGRLGGQRLDWQMFFDLGDHEITHDLLSRASCSPGSPECMGLAIVKAAHGALAGHVSEAREGLAALSEVRDAYLATPDIAENEGVVRIINALADQLPAWLQLLSGDAQGAYDTWKDLATEGVADHLGAAWAADEVGDYEFAERYYLAASWRDRAGVATYRLAKMYERMDRPDDALAQYRRLALMWSEADDDFQPWVETQRALTRLGG